MRTLQQATREELKDFGSLVDPLVKYIEETWEGKILPKGYKEYLRLCPYPLLLMMIESKEEILYRC
jgi:hypothetical protein